MKLASHYLRLREHFSEAKESEEIFITVDELADILDCTHRNVLLILNRMSKENWIEWHPKRGRGHRSTLIFLTQAEGLILQLAKNLVEKKDLRGALEQINVSSMPSLIKENFNEWLYSYFGYRTEVKDQRKIDTLRFPLSGPLVTLDPMHTNFASESHLVKQVFDSLVHYHSLTQTIEPHLAHFWEVNASRTLWTFYLRKGVLFHHGREMTADDVHYSLNRLRLSKERSLYRWVYTQIKQIEIMDPTTIQVELEQPNELFLPFLSTNRAVIVPKDVCEQDVQRFGKTPIGTGPFKLVRNDHSMCELESFPHYFQGRAHLDRLEIWNIPDLYEQERQKHLEHFQIIHNARLPEEGNSAGSQVKRSGTTCKFITFNPLKLGGSMKKPLLRKALCYIMNRQQMIAELDGDSTYEMDGFFTKEATPLEPLDDDTLKALLETGDYQGEVLELCTIPHYELDARVVQRICKQAGIELRVSLLTPEEFKGTQRLTADMILFAVVLDNDIELRLIDLYKSMQAHLEPSMSEQIENLMANILKEPISANRIIQLQKLEEILKQHHLIHFLYKKYQKTVYHSSVKGISLDSLGWVQFKDIWFKGEHLYG